MDERDDEARRILKITTNVCRRRFCLKEDPDYDEAINFAVGFAMAKPPKGGATVLTYAVRVAIFGCHLVHRRRRKWEQIPLDYPDIPDANHAQPIELSIEDTDFLNLVATHGKSLAAILLCLSKEKLKRRLDSISSAILSRRDA